MKLEHLLIESVNPKQMGGQHVGVMSVGVKILHKPTGLLAICDCERSQLSNKRVAMAMIEYGLAEMSWKD